MTLGELEEIVIMSKCLKSDIIYINGNDMFGSDMTYTIIKHTKINNLLPQLVFQIKEWLNLFKELKEKKVDYKNSIIDNTGGHIHFNGLNYYFYSQYPINIFNKKLYAIQSYKMNKSKHYVHDVKQDKNFSNLLDKSYKSENGMFLYRVDNYCISLYKTLLGFTAKNSISLNVYDKDELYIMAEFILNEKNKNPINIFIHCRKLF